MTAVAGVTREFVLNQFWMSSVKDEFDLINAIQTKAGFSCAIEIMDRIGSWEEGDEQENWVGGRRVASMWVYTKAVVCNGQRNMQTFRVNKKMSILQGVNGVCYAFLDNQQWVSQFSMALQETKVLEALNYDIEVLCVVQQECCGSRHQPVSTKTF